MIGVVRDGRRHVSSLRSGTLVVLFSEPALEEPFTVSEVGVRVLNEPV